MKNYPRENGRKFAEALSTWRSPAETLMLIESERSLWGEALLKGGGKPWREAYVACEVATILGGQQVRLGTDIDHGPDFEVQTEKDLFSVQLVEPRDPEKHLYVPGTVYDVDAEVDAILDALVRDLENKAKKNYSQSIVLAARLDMWNFDDRRQEILTRIGGALMQWVDRFREVWIIWDSRIIRASVHSKPT
jgi:hypothetical protein